MTHPSNPKISLAHSAKQAARSKSFSACLSLALLGLTTTPAFAAVITWDGAIDEVWDISATNNWQEGDFQYEDGDDVTFDGAGTAQGTITGANVAPNSVTFSAGSGAYTIDAADAETLSVGAGGLKFLGNAATDDVTINAKLVGSGTITKGDASSGANNVGQTLITHDNSDFNGVTVLNQGDLTISNVNALGNHSTNTITFNNFNVDATFLSITDGGTLYNDFVINKSGFNQSKYIQFTAAGTGDLTLAGNILNDETKGFVFHLFAGNDDTLTVGGLISGAGGLRIQGVNGAVVLANAANSFADGVLIDNSGTVQVATIGDIGVDSAAGANSTTGVGFTIGLGGGSGTLEYTGVGGETDRQVSIGTNNAGVGTGTIKNSGTGTLTWDAITFNAARTSATADRNFTFDTNTADISVTGAIVDNHATNAKIAITKLGSKTLTLGGTSTYTGDTTITAGAFELASGGSMSFLIGADGMYNQILDTGATAITLDGLFVFDTAGASDVFGDSWTIVMSDLETYGTNFDVTDFTEGAEGIWTSGIYQFSELTGDLSVIPEPGTYALLAGCFALASVMIRRRR